MTKLNWDQVGQPVSPARFFNTPGSPAAPALRQNGRAFFGECYSHGQQTDGSVTGGSWLQSFTVNANGLTTTITGLDYGEDTARVVAVSSFGIALSGAARTSGGSGPEEAIGLFALAVNDDGTTPANAWAAYLEANRTHASAGITIGVEINASQLPAASSAGAVGPYGSKGTDWVNVLRIAGGSDGRSTFPTNGVFPRSFAVNAGITFANNGAALWEGIVFDFNALMREGVADDTASPGNSGYARAMTMAHEQGLSWFSRDPVSGAGTQAEVVRMHASVSSPTIRWEMVFSDDAWSLNDRDAPDGAQFQVGYLANAAAHVFAQPVVLGSAPFIEARGVSSNINLLAKGKGTGLFGFGQFTDTGGGSGYIRIVTETGAVVRLTGTLEV